MKISNLKTYEEIVTQDVVCNKCTRSILREEFDLDSARYTRHDFAFTRNFKNQKDEYGISGRYHSGFLSGSTDSDPRSHISDDERFHFSLCEGCLGELFQTFAIPPQYTPDEIDGYTNDDGKWVLDERVRKFQEISQNKNLEVHALDSDPKVRGFAEGRIALQKENK